MEYYHYIALYVSFFDIHPPQFLPAPHRVLLVLHQLLVRKYKESGKKTAEEHADIGNGNIIYIDYGDRCEDQLLNDFNRIPTKQMMVMMMMMTMIIHMIIIITIRRWRKRSHSLLALLLIFSIYFVNLYSKYPCENDARLRYIIGQTIYIFVLRQSIYKNIY